MSHGTIYTFKNYFVTMFSVFSFQFSVSATISSIQIHPMSLWSLNFPCFPSHTWRAWNEKEIVVVIPNSRLYISVLLFQAFTEEITMTISYNQVTLHRSIMMSPKKTCRTTQAPSLFNFISDYFDVFKYKTESNVYYI